MKRVMLLVAFTFASIVVSGQFQVRGKVTDSGGNSLSGANVILEDTFLGTSAGLSGEFSFNNVKPGKYIIQVSYMGFETKKKEIIVQEDVELSITLKRSVYQAGEVIVSATRADRTMPVASTTVSKNKIKKLNSVQDVPYLLRSTPSLVTSSDAGNGVGYTGLRIRGTDLTRINVTINGIPLNDSESHGVWWVDLPDFASSIDNIQIQRGVGTSTNGAGAFGATINLKTFTFSKNPFAEINSVAGSFNTLKNNVTVGTGLINDKFSFNARLSKINSDGYIDRATADLKSFALSGAYYGKKDMIRVNVISGKEKTYQAWDGIPSSILEDDRTYNGIGRYTDKNGEVKYYENEIDNYWQDHFQVFYSNELNPFLYLNFALHYTAGKGYYEQYKEDENFSDYQMENIQIGNNLIEQSDLIRRKWLDNDFFGFTYSLKYKVGKWDASIGGAWNKYFGDHFGNVIWSRFAGDSELDHEWYNNKSIKQDFNIFGKINYYLSDIIKLYGDFQTRVINYEIDGIDDDLRDITQQHKFIFLNPKIGAYLKINKFQSLYISYGIGHREPNRYNFIDADPNGPMPVPEMLMDYELGYKLNLTHLQFNGNIYFMDYKDQLVLTGKINDVGAPVMTNVKDSYRVGIELQAGLKISDMIEYEANITFSRNKIENFTEYVDNWDTGGQVSSHLGQTDLSFSPELVLGSYLQVFPFNNFEVSLFSKYVGEQFIDNTSNENRKLDSWFVNELSVQYSIYPEWVEQMRIKFEINNLFNEEYETNAWVYRYISGGEPGKLDGFFPQAKRNYLLGFYFRF